MVGSSKRELPLKDPLIDQILEDPVEVLPAPSPSQPIAKLGYSHEAMIDVLIANPGLSQDQIAARFGYSASWISQIIASDAFQMRLAERREEIVDPVLRASVKEQFDGVVNRSLEILRQKLARPAQDISDTFALRAFELSSRAAGYGAKVDTPPSNPVNVHLHLEELGANLEHLLRRKKAEVLQGELIEQEVRQEAS